MGWGVGGELGGGVRCVRLSVHEHLRLTQDGMHSCESSLLLLHPPNTEELKPSGLQH